MAWLGMLATIYLRFGQTNIAVDIAELCLRSARDAGQRPKSLRLASEGLR